MKKFLIALTTSRFLQNITMKSIVLIAVLLSATLTMYAETGTMERFGSKMRYTFTGGVVTSKSKATISGTLRDDMTVLIKGEVKPGASLTFGCERMAGPANSKKVSVEYFIQTTDGKKQPAKKKEADGSVGLKLNVPKNAKKIFAFLTYNAVRTKFKAEIEWQVGNGTTATSPSNSETFSSSFRNNRGVKVSYTVTGAKLISGVSGIDRIYMKAQPGATVRVSANTVSGEGGKLNMSCSATDESGRSLHKEELKQKTSASLSYTIPRNATEVSFYMNHNFMPYCSVTIRVLENQTTTSSSTTQPSKKFNWRDVADDEKCPTCKKPAGPLTFEKIGGNGNVVVGCSTLATKKFKKAMVNRPIYAGDGIVTDEYSFAVVRWGNEGKTATIKPNSKVLFEGMVNEKARWRIIYGKIE